MAHLNSDKLNPIGITENSSITFEFGQRRCGPPENWSGPLPGKGCEIFIAKIPKDYFEKDLIPTLREIGEIYTFRLMMETETSHRGFGFCLYTTHETAKQAVLKLNNFQIKKNWYLGVCFSVDNCRLFVGGIPKLKTKLEIHEEMSNFTENVVDIIVYPSAADKHKNRGFAFVEYTNHKAAAIARKKMISNGIQLWGQTVAVDWAEPERKVEDEIMSKVKILYVRNLMLTTTEQIIYRVFSQHLDDPQEIVKVKKIDDFAFVHFKSREPAEIVKNKTHGISLEGSTIEVHFAKPVNKMDQQQKLLKKSAPIVNQALQLTGDFNRLSLNINGNQLLNTDNTEKNGINNRSYRNAAGRCSIKSRQIMKNIENENLTNNFISSLNQICHKYKWGGPFYTMHYIPMIIPNNDSPVNVFMAQVYIPGLNLSFPSKVPAFTQEDAVLQCSENALLYLLYNGIQIPFLFEKVDQLPKLENFNKSFSETEILNRSVSNCDSTDLGTNTNIQRNPPKVYFPQGFPYNATSCYSNNVIPSSYFYSSSDVNEFYEESADQNIFPI